MNAFMVVLASLHWPCWKVPSAHASRISRLQSAKPPSSSVSSLQVLLPSGRFTSLVTRPSETAPSPALPPAPAEPSAPPADASLPPAEPSAVPASVPPVEVPPPVAFPPPVLLPPVPVLPPVPLCAPPVDEPADPPFPDPVFSSVTVVTHAGAASALAI